MNKKEIVPCSSNDLAVAVKVKTIIMIMLFAGAIWTVIMVWVVVGKVWDGNHGSLGF